MHLACQILQPCPYNRQNGAQISTIEQDSLLDWSIWFVFQLHNNLIVLSSWVLETEQYYGMKSCGWAILSCFEASQWPSCLLNESTVIPFTLVCSFVHFNNKSQPAREIWFSPQKAYQHFFPSMFLGSPCPSHFLLLVEVFTLLAVLLFCNLCDWQDHVPQGWGVDFIICNFSWVNIAGSLVKQR